MSWKSFALGDILKRKRITEKIVPDIEYKLVTIKLYHKGVVLRKIVKGVEIGSSMSRINAGDFILSGIDARNGAFGIVPDELDGAVVTNDFWCLEPNEGIINKEFLLYLTTTDFFDYICKQSSDGTTQRIRLQKDKFFSYQISLPSTAEQKSILNKLKNTNNISTLLSSELNLQQTLLTQLRQAFLREAMQGRLVMQDLKDGDGKDLLEKIKKECLNSSTASGRSKKEKTLSPITENEIPFEIPENWAWCKIAQIAQHNSGKTLDNGRNSGKERKCITTSNLYWGFFELDKLKTILIEDNELNRCTASKGDLLVCEGGEAGRAAIWNYDYDICFQNHIHRIKPFGGINSSFLFWYFLFLNLSGEINKYRKGMGISNLSGKALSSIIVPLPPLSEQTRIVKKLDELMQLCDSLQQSIQASKAQNELLLQQVLREALRG